jgi:hypothetical protein
MSKEWKNYLKGLVGSLRGDKLMQSRPMKSNCWRRRYNQLLGILKRGFIGPSKCVICGLKEENVKHLFVECNFTQTFGFIYKWN